MVTTAQAEQLGVPRRDLSRLVTAGALERIDYGVYRIAGSPRPRWEELRAAWLKLAPALSVDERNAGHGVVSHQSATLVHQLGLLEPLTHEFTVPPSRRVRSRRTDVLIHRAGLSPDEMEWADELLVTTPIRTVTDLCRIRLDGEHLSGVVADALTRQLVDEAALLAVLGQHAEAYGFAAGGSSSRF
nr:type IV toxin-antitoxin system AbiEi family antitoxin domain-containing protein [Planobispora longispora]